MNILVSSVIDINRTAKNRLHHFIDHLSEQHSLTVVCPEDTWRESQVDVGNYSATDRFSRSNVECVYLSDSSLDVRPSLQEALSEVILREGSTIDYATYDVHLDYNTIFLGQAIARRVRKHDIPTLYDLADEGMNLHPKVYAQVQKKLRELGE